MFGSKEQVWEELTAYVSEKSITLDFVKSLASLKISSRRKRDLAAEVASGSMDQETAISLARAESDQIISVKDRIGYFWQKYYSDITFYSSLLVFFIVIIGGLWILVHLKGNPESKQTRLSISQQKIDYIAEEITNIIVSKYPYNKRLCIAETTLADILPYTSDRHRKNITETVNIILNVNLHKQMQSSILLVSNGDKNNLQLKSTVTGYDEYAFADPKVRVYLNLFDPVLNEILWQDEIDIGSLCQEKWK